MNGRIYDPLLGRFLSADTFVDGPFDLQGYNRYTYVKNRPLSVVDPSGWMGIPVLPPMITPDSARGGLRTITNFVAGIAAGLIEANSTAKIDTTGNSAATFGKVVGNALGVVQGVLEVGGGGTIAGGGGAVTVTGVGAPIGVPAAAAGTALAAHGAVVTANATTRLANSIQQLKSEMRAAPKTGSDGGKVDPVKSSPTEGGGGTHSETRKPSNDGKDSHHMPSRESTGDMPDSLAPSIKIDPPDHAATPSNGQQGLAGAEFSATQGELWNSGNPQMMRDAMANEVKGVRDAAREVSGDATKYNAEMLEMLKKAKENGVLPPNQ